MSHILKLYFLDGHFIRYRGHLFECKGNLSQRVVEVYIHTFNPCRSRYSCQYIHMIRGCCIRCIAQHHFAGIGEVRSGCIRTAERIPGKEPHARILQAGPILQRRDRSCQVGVYSGTCIEILLRSRRIGCQRTKKTKCFSFQVGIRGDNRTTSVDIAAFSDTLHNNQFLIARHLFADTRKKDSRKNSRCYNHPDIIYSLYHLTSFPKLKNTTGERYYKSISRSMSCLSPQSSTVIVSI